MRSWGILGAPRGVHASFHEGLMVAKDKNLSDEALANTLIRAANDSLGAAGANVVLLNAGAWMAVARRAKELLGMTDAERRLIDGAIHYIRCDSDDASLALATLGQLARNVIEERAPQPRWVLLAERGVRDTKTGSVYAMLSESDAMALVRALNAAEAPDAP